MARQPSPSLPSSRCQKTALGANLLWEELAERPALGCKEAFRVSRLPLVMGAECGGRGTPHPAASSRGRRARGQSAGGLPRERCWQVLLCTLTAWDASPATGFDANHPTNSLRGLTSPLGEKKPGENESHGKLGSLQQLSKSCCPRQRERGGSQLPFP